MTSLENNHLEENPAARRPATPAFKNNYGLRSELTSSIYEEFDQDRDMVRPSHWSIAWSDLMMTMFILFLSMFVYQSAQQEFLAEQSNEIVAGTTTEAFDVISETDLPNPLEPSPKLPFITAGTLPATKPIKESGSRKEVFNEVTENQVAKQVDNTLEIKQLTTPNFTEVATVQEQSKVEDVEVQAKNIANILPKMPDATELVSIEGKTSPSQQNGQTNSQTISEIAQIKAPENNIFPRPITDDPPIKVSPPTKSEPIIKPVVKESGQLKELFTLSQKAVGKNNLDKFASVNLVPDKTVRIILTGDLLFDLGQSALSSGALKALGSIAETIKSTPYMINIVGHTDNVPMTSGRFPSNWELSVARASSVARFLIDKVGINPNQIAVSGYASYRPIKPNTTSANRASNRRVEIIITKRLPSPVSPNQEKVN